MWGGLQPAREACAGAFFDEDAEVREVFDVKAVAVPPHSKR